MCFSAINDHLRGNENYQLYLKKESHFISLSLKCKVYTHIIMTLYTVQAYEPHIYQYIGKYIIIIIQIF